ncbi:hypothetical protein MKJ01_05375 [Chryseobacterium sp. SSA4.19]|uniref:hypothetical protein n=1 Tax=Chryseobacterium sp. SSA4.19 TaxID=2919915 RepID=UPI001F4E7188|nr:hypothetical protein [Chryseobacterium sp. SSA4.19]MCJ8153191.1 hypothetical protein [Chryseobacterium sp. SSA4.19]
MRKFAKNYNPIFGNPRKNEAAFTSIANFEEILDRIDDLIGKEIHYYNSNNEKYSTFVVNAFDKNSIEIIIYTLNKSGNTVSRKYDIKTN